MIYEIQTKNDFLTGASLIVKIPEDELDIKALYTIQADRPAFILPFSYRSVDGQVEFVYQIGSYCKLQYLSGICAANEYAELWAGILNPLLECGDWFMNPYSFVLGAGYLYCDKTKRTVSYVYVPSVRGCSGYDALKEMAAEVTKLITVEDINLENRILRSIMKDFHPAEFMKMLKSYITAGTTHVCSVTVPEQLPPHAGYAAPPSPVPVIIHDDLPARSNVAGKSRDGMQVTKGDIVINIPADGKKPKKKQAAQKYNRKTAGDAATEVMTVKKAGNLFGKRTETPPDGSSDFPREMKNAVLPCLPASPVYMPPEDTQDDTQSIQDIAGATRLRFVGSAFLPPIINIRIAEGEVFTIGRFDAAYGKQQSDFEFDKMTKAVSRRHAAIERGVFGYSIVDLSSSAGTYVNGQKLPPNTSYVLEYGCRVSLGNAGADYIWEE